MTKPLHPYAVLALAALLPGGGHVAAGDPARGLGFAFSALFFAFLTWQLSSPEQSFVARSALGLFVWALSIPDAYRIARVRYELWRQGERSGAPRGP